MWGGEGTCNDRFKQLYRMARKVIDLLVQLEGSIISDEVIWKLKNPPKVNIVEFCPKGWSWSSSWGLLPVAIWWSPQMLREEVKGTLICGTD
ncbi:hypothetical protein AQUCO_00300767v1 [Aquilegia coerulea]|uniref:Uncharacterized protein n=1 Tax=Aquilegia coerulea TaxID=218851 RepID=A0A2G5F0I0_AQUCA|nr:hypothetical protein AQUCO_00300767v1 [Aquilegia coerulea]